MSDSSERFYSSNPQAQYKRMRYAMHEEIRARICETVRAWRRRQKQDPLLSRREYVRQQIYKGRVRIEKAERRLAALHERMEKLCREQRNLKARIVRRKQFAKLP